MYEKIITKDFLTEEYIVKRKSTCKIAKKLKCSFITILRYLKKYNITTRSIKESTKGINKGNRYTYIDGRTLKKYFCIDCKAILKSGTAWKNERCGSCAGKKHGESIKGELNHFYGKFGNKVPGYKNGKPRCTDCNKRVKGYNAKRCAECNGKIKSIKMSGKGNPMYGKSTHGKGEYYNGNFMRSSWEIAYAKYLDKLGIKWEYEQKSFPIKYIYKGKKKEGTYRPDFYLTCSDVWIEVKGWWRDDAKIKFNAFKRIYPNYIIKVLRKNDLEKLGVLK